MKMGNCSPDLSIKHPLNFLSGTRKGTNLEYEIKSVVVDRKRTNELPEESRLSEICLLSHLVGFFRIPCRYLYQGQLYDKVR